LGVDLYPSEQLGSERECLELLQIGSLGMTKVSAAVLENFAPSSRAGFRGSSVADSESIFTVTLHPRGAARRRYADSPVGH
jgi:hypothetical protein